MTRPTFGYVWLSVYEPAGAAKRMEALKAMDPAAFAAYRDSGGTTTLGVQPPIPPGAQASRAAGAAVPIKVSFTEGSLAAPDAHLLELSPVFGSEREAHDWLEKHEPATSVGWSNRVLLTVSARSGGE